jgi:hypothetical protein
LGSEASAAEAAAAAEAELKVTVTTEEALRLAAAEGLTLVPSSRSLTGYKHVTQASARVGFYAQAKHDGIYQYLGYASTAEEAALLYARHLGPEASAAEAAADATAKEERAKKREIAALAAEEEAAAKRAKKQLEQRQRKEAAEAAKRMAKREQVLQAQRDLEARRQQAAMEQVAGSRGIRHDAGSHCSTVPRPRPCLSPHSVAGQLLTAPARPRRSGC